MPPDPSIHIKDVFELLKNEDSKGFDQLVFPEVTIRNMRKELLDEYVFLIQETNDILMEMIGEKTEISEEEVVRELRQDFLDDFKDILKDGRKDGLDWKNAQLLGYTWKMVGNSETPYEFKCNSKMYIKSGVHTYCIKYKNLLFYNGKWFAGRMIDIEKITGDGYYMPDMYNAPSVEEFLDESPSEYDEVNELPLEEVEEITTDEASEED